MQQKAVYTYCTDLITVDLGLFSALSHVAPDGAARRSRLTGPFLSPFSHWRELR